MWNVRWAPDQITTSGSQTVSTQQVDRRPLNKNSYQTIYERIGNTVVFWVFSRYGYLFFYVRDSVFLSVASR